MQTYWACLWAAMFIAAQWTRFRSREYWALFAIMTCAAIAGGMSMP